MSGDVKVGNPLRPAEVTTVPNERLLSDKRVKDVVSASMGFIGLWFSLATIAESVVTLRDRISIGDLSPMTTISTVVEVAKRILPTLEDKDSKPPLIEALLQRKNEGEIRNLLAKPNVDINERDETDSTPLMYAVYNGDVDIVSLLLDQPSLNAQIPNKKGDTAFIIALSMGNTEIAKLFIDHQIVDINRIHIKELSPLAWAVVNEKSAMVDLLIRNKAEVTPDNTNTFLPQERTPLSYAIETGNTEIVELLLKGGADINEVYGDKPENTTSPLEIAINNNDVRMVQFLLSKGVDVTKENGEITYLEIAAVVGNVKIAELLLQQGMNINKANDRGETPLMWAVTQGNVSMVEFLLSRGANVNKADRGGRTALILAAQSSATHKNEDKNQYTGLDHLQNPRFQEDKAIVLMLRDNGANLNRLYKEKTALDFLEADNPLSRSLQKKGAHTADELGSSLDINQKIIDFNTRIFTTAKAREAFIEEIKESLLQGKTDIDKKDDKNRTPLHNAILCRNTALIELLIAQGANVNAIDEEENTPLQLVAKSRFFKDSYKVGKLLVDNGANVNSKDKLKRRTPLHNAIRLGNRKLASLLIRAVENTKDVNQTDTQGRTPMHYAVLRNDFWIVERLVEAKASLSKKNQSGRTPLDLAGSIRRSTIRKFLLRKGAVSGKKK